MTTFVITFFLNSDTIDTGTNHTILIGFFLSLNIAVVVAALVVVVTALVVAAAAAATSVLV